MAVLPTLHYPQCWHWFWSAPGVHLQLHGLSHTINHTLTLHYDLKRTVEEVLSGDNESCWRAVLPAPRLRNVTRVLLWCKAKAHGEGQSLLAHKTRLLCFLSHFQWCNVKSARKLSIKTLAEGMRQSLFITYSLSMKAMTRSVWLSKQQLRDIRADEASVQTEMTTFWQKPDDRPFSWQVLSQPRTTALTDSGSAEMLSLCLSSWGMFHTDPKPAACGSSWLLHVEERSAPSYPAEEMLKYISLKYSMVISFGCPRSCFGNHRMV